MKERLSKLLQMALVLVLFVSCYPDDEEIFEKYSLIQDTESSSNSGSSNDDSQSTASLTLSKTSLSFDEYGGSEEVVVTSDYNYTVTYSDSWISISQNGNTLVVNVSANSKLAAKEGVITVSSGNISNTIRVYQDAAETPVVTITKAGSVNWAPYIKAKVDTKGTSISKCGVIMKHNYLYEVPSFTVNSNDAIKYGTLGDDGTFRVDFGQYFKSGYFFFKAFVITTDGDVVYSKVTKCLQMSGRQN